MCARDSSFGRGNSILRSSRPGGRRRRGEVHYSDTVGQQLVHVQVTCMHVLYMRMYYYIVHTRLSFRNFV